MEVREAYELPWLDSRTPKRNACHLMDFVLDPIEGSGQILECNDWTTFRKVVLKCPFMTSPPVISNPTNCNGILHDLLDVCRPAVRSCVNADFKIAEKPDFHGTSVITLFKEMIFKDHMSVRITSNILQPRGSGFDTDTGPILVFTSIFHSNGASSWP